jgi:hypothetical protein
MQRFALLSLYSTSRTCKDKHAHGNAHPCDTTHHTWCCQDPDISHTAVIFHSCNTEFLATTTATAQVQCLQDQTARHSVPRHHACYTSSSSRQQQQLLHSSAVRGVSAIRAAVVDSIAKISSTKLCYSSLTAVVYAVSNVQLVDIRKHTRFFQKLLCQLYSVSSSNTNKAVVAWSS